MKLLPPTLPNVINCALAFITPNREREKKKKKKKKKIERGPGSKGQVKAKIKL